jgi:hypothetical protein
MRAVALCAAASSLAGDLGLRAVPFARIDGNEAIPYKTHDLSSFAIERCSNGVEKLVQRIDIDFAARGFGKP